LGIKTVAEYAENDAIIQEFSGVCKPKPLFEGSLGAVSLPRADAAVA
jgi:hypothetical protein